MMEIIASSFSCRDQFICLSFGQLTHRQSLRDIVTCLQAQKAKHYQLVIRGNIARSTFAEANEKRDWRIYADLAQILIRKVCKNARLDPNSEIELDNAVYALDSTTIDLCLNVFWWAKFRRTKAAIKLHTLLDVKCEIPFFVHITEAAQHDVNALDVLEIQAESSMSWIEGMWIGNDYTESHQGQAFFVIRAKQNLAFTRTQSRKVDKRTGLRCDQTIRLNGYYAKKSYLDKLRRIKFYDIENRITYV